MTLKPKLSNFLALSIGGFFFMWLSFGIMFAMKEFHWALGILALLGIAFSLLGIHVLLNRKHNTLEINELGIRKYFPNGSSHIPASQIELIKEFASLKGRGVTISMKSGEIINFDCRNYCSIPKFLTYCRKVGLPCA